MHDESNANRLPGTIIRVGNRPSQTTRYEFLYIHRLKNISVFQRTASCYSKVSSSFYKKRMARFEFYGARRNGGRHGWKASRLESVPRKADSRENRVHNDPLNRETGTQDRRYGRNMWGNRMVILCETNCSANSCRLLRWAKELGQVFSRHWGRKEDEFLRRFYDDRIFSFSSSLLSLSLVKLECFF